MLPTMKAGIELNSLNTSPNTAANTPMMIKTPSFFTPKKIGYNIAKIYSTAKK